MATAIRRRVDGEILMVTRSQIVDILKSHQQYLLDNYGVRRIGIFGSFAKGTPNKHSDVDIVVEFERPMGIKFFELVDFLEQILKRKTDVLTVEGIRSIRMRKIIEDIERSIMYV